MIRIDRLTHGYGPRILFRKVSLEIETGECVSLSGASGSGKSSFLHLLAGLMPPDSGDISVGGRLASTSGHVEIPPHQRGVGFVFQSAALWPHMTVAQNVLFGLGGLPLRDRSDRLERVLQATGITALAGRHPDTLSGGEQRRVALARALAPEPRILLLDEPLSNLDAGSKSNLAALIAAAARATRATVIYVSHDPREAAELCVRFFALKAERITEMEPPR